MSPEDSAVSAISPNNFRIGAAGPAAPFKAFEERWFVRLDICQLHGYTSAIAHCSSSIAEYGSPS